MNLIGCWFSATPYYHGAEGIARQYKFGGMSGWCVALLGVAKLVLGLGSSLVKILDQFPVGVLGVLLLFTRIELAMCSIYMNSKEEFVVMLCLTCWLKEESEILFIVLSKSDLELLLLFLDENHLHDFSE
ncbi:Molybdate transporter 1 [Forsythia ovata]|uniref:Molybdate transporter 1 n=1 Tax=Forsythia ovata TaxID=205694 RepID=A0ABD1RNJ5_9LAMI